MIFMCARGVKTTVCLEGRRVAKYNGYCLFLSFVISYNLIKFRKIPLWFLNLKVIECELENWLQETLLKHCWDSELESRFNVCQHHPCLAYFIDYFATYGIYDYLMWKYSCDFRVYLMNWRTGERETLQKHCWDSELESWFNVCQHHSCFAYSICYFATYCIYDFRIYLMSWRTG